MADPDQPISGDDYGPDTLGPSLDPYVEEVAAAYVIHLTDPGALRYIAQQARSGLDLNTGDISDDELEGIIEHWVWQNYDHLDPP